MKQITDRLLADMRWRLWGPGRRLFRPSRTEAEGWGSRTTGWASPMVAGCVTQILGAGVMLSAILANNALVLASTVVAMLLSWPLWFLGAQALQRRRDYTAYRKRVASDERFALLEYYGLLGRQMRMAELDASLGGPAEVQRLAGLRTELKALLDRGAGLDRRPAQSTLSDEAELAQSVVEAYKLEHGGGLQTLDQRLPEEIRSRLEELEVDDTEARHRSREKR